MNVDVIASDLDSILIYDAGRYEGWSLDKIIGAMRGATLQLLKRGTLSALIARREWGGLLVAASKLLTTYQEQVSVFRRILDLDYADARRHMKVWIYWERIAKMLRDREASCRARGVPFIVPGYRRCLSLAGVSEKRGPAPYQSPPSPVESEELPNDVTLLKKMVEELQQDNRTEREANVRLTVQLDIAHDELRDLSFDAQRAGTRFGFVKRAGGWFRRKLHLERSHHPTEIEVRIGNCLDLIETEANVYDAIVTDPPYSIALHGYEWDSDVSFDPVLWNRFKTVLKPGGYVAFFAAPRNYHRAAQAAEQAGFDILPFLAWRFREGLPKPINVSELFDRDNLEEREVTGQRRGSGFTQANVDHGFQNRTHTTFNAYARHVSEEAQAWRGYYYGKNALKPCIEPILLVQKPIETGRMIDNIRQWGTGALNIGLLQDQYGFWPSTLFTHRKTSKAEHQSDHPSVKPVSLMEDLCLLICPAGGRILDPFAGTGTTGIAAKKRNFDCVLIEQNQVMRQVIEDRMLRET